MRSRGRTRRRRSRLRRLFDLVLALAILGLLAVLAVRIDPREVVRNAGVPVVNDGDSLSFGTERLRLRGIDAPELSQTCRRAGADYACGREARSALAGLVDGRPVDCEGDEHDRYGRLLAVCTVEGLELNRAMVAFGWAVAYGSFEAEEAAARAAGAGLWAGSFDRPRDWRSAHGGMAEVEHVAGWRFASWLRALLRLH